jgi:hypothetical protein
MIPLEANSTISSISRAWTPVAKSSPTHQSRPSNFAWYCISHAVQNGAITAEQRVQCRMHMQCHIVIYLVKKYVPSLFKILRKKNIICLRPCLKSPFLSLTEGAQSQQTSDTAKLLCFVPPPAVTKRNSHGSAHYYSRTAINGGWRKAYHLYWEVIFSPNPILSPWFLQSLLANTGILIWTDFTHLYSPNNLWLPTNFTEQKPGSVKYK